MRVAVLVEHRIVPGGSDRQRTDNGPWHCSALAHRRAVRTLQCWQFLVIFRFYKTLEQTRSPGDDKFGK